jgi:hypothetical protein
MLNARHDRACDETHDETHDDDEMMCNIVLFCLTPEANIWVKAKADPPF